MCFLEFIDMKLKSNLLNDKGEQCTQNRLGLFWYLSLTINYQPLLYQQNVGGGLEKRLKRKSLPVSKKRDGK